ncbi:hypothetical protein OH818_11715 [Jiella pelagia]|uniref:Uncharacterized protein n=1 Tax=Jiella pelagia TaxID=2986949 RepID=A0ABY7C6E2_9HYPH|nr:hypothetical protein OH818_11715 [Jiella pelagia]
MPIEADLTPKKQRFRRSWKLGRRRRQSTMGEAICEAFETKACDGFRAQPMNEDRAIKKAGPEGPAFSDLMSSRAVISSAACALRRSNCR